MKKLAAFFTLAALSACEPEIPHKIDYAVLDSYKTSVEENVIDLSRINPLSRVSSISIFNPNRFCLHFPERLNDKYLILGTQCYLRGPNREGNAYNLIPLGPIQYTSINRREKNIEAPERKTPYY